MKKQEKIQEAYGAHFEQLKEIITENGWVSFYHDESRIRDIFHKDENIECSPNHNNNWRPKSLQGIENNNGWIKIESESDLPEFTTNCWVVKNKIIINQSIYKNKGFITDGITHYKTIIKPEPPIY